MMLLVRSAPALPDKSFLFFGRAGGGVGGACFSRSAGFEQTLTVSVTHAFVPNTCCKVVISWFFISM